jgi:hypothetical protein
MTDHVADRWPVARGFGYRSSLVKRAADLLDRRAAGPRPAVERCWMPVDEIAASHRDVSIR